VPGVGGGAASTATAADSCQDLDVGEKSVVGVSAKQQRERVDRWIRGKRGAQKAPSGPREILSLHHPDGCIVAICGPLGPLRGGDGWTRRQDALIRSAVSLLHNWCDHAAQRQEVLMRV
jgi:hypothetical protein